MIEREDSTKDGQSDYNKVTSHLQYFILWT